MIFYCGSSRLATDNHHYYNYVDSNWVFKVVCPSTIGSADLEDFHFPLKRLLKFIIIIQNCDQKSADSFVKVVCLQLLVDLSEVIHGVTNICQMTMDAEFYRVTLWLDILQSLPIYQISPLSVGFRCYGCLFPQPWFLKLLSFNYEIYHSTIGSVFFL